MGIYISAGNLLLISAVHLQVLFFATLFEPQ